MESIKIYNTPYEIGIRVLVLLDKSEKPLDLQRLIIYDYLVLHYGDIDNRYQSLHPDNPFHATELFIRRDMIINSIKLICRKGLVDIKLLNTGIYYKSNELGHNFLSYFESGYFNKLKDNATLVIDKFEKYSDTNLKDYIDKNVGNWKDEFENEALFRG